MRNHAKAQKEYLRVVEESQVKRNQPATAIDASTSNGQASNDLSPLSSYTNLLSQRQRLEKLQILQDYLEKLSKSPSSSPDYLQPKSLLATLDPLPQLPADIVTSSEVGGLSTNKTDLKDLVSSLEKSVLKAKVLLGNEKKLLAQLRDSTANSSNDSTDENWRLSALNRTRDELIGWVEEELSKTSDGSSKPTSAMTPAESYVSAAEALPQVQSKYSQYTTARQDLVDAISKDPDISEFAIKQAVIESSQVKEADTTTTTNHVVLPYLKELLTISNDQKGLIQQRSHNASTLTKGKQEISSAMDRLAGESHLLPAYPLPDARKRRGAENTPSFDEEIARVEKVDPAKMARTWIYAAETAGTSTKEMLIENVEEGGAAVEESRQSLVELHQLMGRTDHNTSAEKDTENSQSVDQGVDGMNIWSTLDGELGVIRRDSQ